jgi:hypothetical protein
MTVINYAKIIKLYKFNDETKIIHYGCCCWRNGNIVFN